MQVLHGAVDLNSSQVGAALLKIAIYWSVVTHRDTDASNALGHLSTALPNIPLAVENVLLESGGTREKERVVMIKLHELREGMMLRHNVKGIDGRTLIRAGLPLTETIIEKLKLHEDSLDHVKFAVDPEYVRRAYASSGVLA